MNHSRPNIFFRYVIIASSIFVVTILALVAGVFGDNRAPVHQWLNRNGTHLIIVEVIVIGVVGLLALTIDRLRTLKEQAGEDASNAGQENS